MVTKETTGSIIQKFRTGRDESLVTFAENLGVSKTAVMNWESDRSEVDSERLDQWVTSKTQWISEMGVEIYSVMHSKSIAQFMKVVERQKQADGDTQSEAVAA